MAAATTSISRQTAAAAASKGEHTTDDGTDFEGLVRLYYGVIFRLQLHWTMGDHASAGDLTQDTFVRAQRAFEMFSGSNDGARRWLARIASNRFLDYYKIKRRRATIIVGSIEEPVCDDIPEHEPPDSSGSAFDKLVLQDRSRLVNRMLLFLNPDQRAVVILCDMGGHSHEEAARALGIAVGTVKSRWSRAHEKLRGLAQRLINSDDPMLDLL